MAFIKPSYKNIPILVRINPDQMGVVTFGGKVVDVRQPGFEGGIPLLHQIAILDMVPHRHETGFSVVCKGDEYSGLDVGLELPTMIAVRYQIKEPRVYMERAPHDLDNEIDILLRGKGRQEIAREYSWKNIFYDRERFRESIEQFIVQQIGQWGVFADNVELVDVVFPEFLSDAAKRLEAVNIEGPVRLSEAGLEQRIAGIKAMTEALVYKTLQNAEVDIEQRRMGIAMDMQERLTALQIELAKAYGEAFGQEYGAIAMTAMQSSATGSHDLLDALLAKVKTRMGIEAIGEGAQRVGVKPGYAMLFDALKNMRGISVITLGDLSRMQADFDRDRGPYK